MMNLMNNSYYKNFKKYSDLVKEKCVIYECATNVDDLFRRIQRDFYYCKKRGIKPYEVYVDLVEENSLENKPNLRKLFELEEDLDILSYDDQSVFSYYDMHEVARLLDDNNFGIYLIKDDKYYLERKPLLYWLSQ